MRQPTLTPSRAVWIVCVSLVLLPTLAAAADLGIAADFDSDGRRDHVMLDRREPSVLKVWLSASGTTHFIHTRVPLLRIIATDLDGDHRPELIARDSKSQIHVWTRKHQGFRSYGPRLVLPVVLKRPIRRSVDDHDTEPAGAIAGTTFEPVTPTLCASPPVPALGLSNACTPRSARALGSLTTFDPFVPRPPPAHHLPL